MKHDGATVFFFNDTATTEIYTLSLHDALPIFRRCLPAPHERQWRTRRTGYGRRRLCAAQPANPGLWRQACQPRSEEHTSELQSRQYLVCRLLLEKKRGRRPRLTLA